MEKETAIDPPAEWGMAMLDTRPDQIALLDANGMILAVNAAWRRFARENGVAPDRPVPGTGIDYAALCEAACGASTEGAEDAARGIREVLARKRPIFSLEYPCHSAERRRWFLMLVSALDVAGVAAIVVHTEITARKVEELGRRDGELRLQLALDATGDGLWDWDLATGQAYLSPGYYAMTGYREEDEPGSLDFFRRLVHPEDWPSVMATIEAHLRGETPDSRIEYRMLTATGESRWVRGLGRVVEHDAAGAPRRMLGTITDITVFKAIELALRDSEARLRAVVEDQTELISRFAVDGTILFVNEVYCRLFGRSAGDIIGHKWQPAAHPDDLPMIEARLAELAADNPVVVIENRVFAADGTTRWMQFVNRGFFDDAGRLREIQSVGRDVTDRHELEERQRRLLLENLRLGRELIRLQEAERAALAKELHDELNQQLVAIRAYAGAIQRRTDGPRDASHRDALAIGNAASDIYAISHRLMEGLHPQALDSDGLVGAVAGLVDHWSLARPDLRVRLRATGSGPADPELRINLFRIVQECLANAVQHGHARRIRIFIGEWRSTMQTRLRIVVRDDGVGMRLDAPRSGYGLILMRERAPNLGGSLDLRSLPGRGTRVAVEVRLPG